MATIRDRIKRADESLESDLADLLIKFNEQLDQVGVAKHRIRVKGKKTYQSKRPYWNTGPTV